MPVFNTPPTPSNPEANQVMTPDFVSGVIDSKLQRMSEAAEQKVAQAESAKQLAAVEAGEAVVSREATIIPLQPKE